MNEFPKEMFKDRMKYSRLEMAEEGWNEHKKMMRKKIKELDEQCIKEEWGTYELVKALERALR